MSGPRIAFLLGRSPGRGSVLPVTLRRLGAAGARVRVDILGEYSPPPPHTLAADLVVLRALDPATLGWTRALEAAGVRCCNTVQATATARDKVETHRRLAASHVRVPCSELAGAWTDVIRLAGDRPAVVKAVTGSRGNGVLLVEPGRVPPAPPFSGPWLVQERLQGDGHDRKLYVAGNWIGGVLRRWPPRSLREKRGSALAINAQLADIARQVGHRLGLEIYGVDVVVGQGGPCVVDVNAFPGFKGVPGAASWIADYLLHAASADSAALEEVDRCAW